jgi:uncharacterized protein (DUF39 family)
MKRLKGRCIVAEETPFGIWGGEAEKHHFKHHFLSSHQLERNTSYYRKCVIDACISSRVRPLVSGTNFATNRTAKPQTPENMKNVPDDVECQNIHVILQKREQAINSLQNMKVHHNLLIPW